MALVLKDRVLESSTSTGTGSFTLTGAQTGYQSFSAIGNGNTTYYTIQGKNSDGTLTGEWEVGVGTWSTGNTLSRDTVLSNSLGTTAKIAFSAGAKDVFCDYPASKSVNQNADNKVLIPYTSGVTNVGSLNVGDATAHSDLGVIAAFTASEPLYLYTSLQNTSSANTSYASYAVNDGGHTSYGELGINNSNYSYTAAGYPNNTFSAPLATFVESYGGPLAIGTWDSQKISFIVNGSVNTADAMTINAAGNVSTANDITVNGITIGRGAGNFDTNTVIGNGSFSSNITGTNNIIIGKNNLALTADSNNNVIISNSASVNYTTGSIYIGANATPSYTDPIKEIVIGNTTGGGDYSMVLGNNDTEITTIKGSVSVNVGNLSATGLSNNGALTIFGNATSNQSIATSQTTGTLAIGGTATATTGTITLSAARGAQTVNIATGAQGSGVTKTINIGTGGATGANTIINIGRSSTGTTSATTILSRTLTLTAGAGNINISNTLVQTTTVVGSLTASTVGARAFVTDALTPVFGSVVVGGGAVPVPVYYDGTNWRVG